MLATLILFSYVSLMGDFHELGPDGIPIHLVNFSNRSSGLGIWLCCHISFLRCTPPAPSGYNRRPFSQNLKSRVGIRHVAPSRLG